MADDPQAVYWIPGPAVPMRDKDDGFGEAYSEIFRAATTGEPIEALATRTGVRPALVAALFEDAAKCFVAVAVSESDDDADDADEEKDCATFFADAARAAEKALRDFEQSNPLWRINA